MPNKVTITGFKEYADKLEKLSVEFPNDLNEIAGFAAATWQQLADRTAPKDFGKLSGVINTLNEKPGLWSVNSPQEYSPYMEWGTKSKAHVPGDLQAYASQFIGPGTGTNPKDLIYAWVLRKGLGKKAQWPIFISIMRHGVRAANSGVGYFFIHRAAVQKQMDGDLKQLLETLD